MGFTEALVKVIFWPRVRKARKIGEAAELIGQGRAEETLARLAEFEHRIPPYLGFLFFLTRGRALEALERWEEAEQSYLAAVFAKQGANLAYLHMAVLCGRRWRLDEARDWLRRIREDEEAEAELLEQADELEALIEQVENGRRLEEMERRAETFSKQRGVDGVPLLDAARRLDQWLVDSPEDAARDCDELACYLGEQVVRQLGGHWKVNLNLEDSVVEVPGREGPFAPFAIVARALEGEAALSKSLSEEVERGLEESSGKPRDGESSEASGG